MLPRLDAQAAATLRLRAAAVWELLSSLALPGSQNPGQMSPWLWASQVVCLAAAAQERELTTCRSAPSLLAAEWGLGSLGPPGQRSRAPGREAEGEARRRGRTLRPRARSQSHGLLGHAPPALLVAQAAAAFICVCAGSSRQATSKPASYPNLAEPGPDAAVTAAKPGSLPGGGRTTSKN